MAVRTDTSVRINEIRRMKLEKGAIEITVATNKITKISDVVNYLLDNYLQEAIKDMKSKRE